MGGIPAYGIYCRGRGFQGTNLVGGGGRAVSKRRGIVHKNRKIIGFGAGDYFAQVGTGRCVHRFTTHSIRQIVEDRQREMVLEGIMRGTRNKDHITKYQAGAGGQAGGGTLGVEAREFQYCNLVEEKAHEGDPYTLWSGVLCMGN